MSDKMANYIRITGIDFGTSTSVVKTKMYDSKGRPVGQELFTQSLTFNNGASMVPTVVRRNGEKYAFGYEAEVPAKDSEVFRSFKLDLQNEDLEKAGQAKELTQLFFRYLHNEFEHQLSTGCLGDVGSDNKTIVSYPVKWNDSTRDFMISCAVEAGFENVTGMDEAEAAIRAVTVQCSEMLNNNGLICDGVPNNIMLIDMGAGTTDIVICKYTSGENFSNEILSTWPKSGDILFGGREFDELLKEYVVSKFPENYRSSVSKKITIDKIKTWKENNVSPAMRNGGCVSEFSEADNIAYFLDITLDDFNINKELFENMFHQKIMQFTKLVGEAILDSGLEPGDIDFIIITGGNSRWYFVDDILSCRTDRFGDLNMSKIKSDPTGRILKVALPQETVALGMAYSKISGAIEFNKGEHLWKQYLQTGDRNILQQAVALENPEAMNEWGVTLIKENPSEKMDEAIELFKKSSQKLSQASYNLGCCYLRKEMLNEAFNEFEKAAEDLLPQAINNVGVCYMEGIGVSVDYNKALECFAKAIEFGYMDARKNYSELRKKIHPDDPDPYDDKGDVVDAAKQALGSNTVVGFCVGNTIPQSKLATFMTSFTGTNVLNETIICYLDDTFFGGGKDGFLMTDKKLYAHELLGIGRVFDVSTIEGFSIVNNEIRFSLDNGQVLKLSCSNSKKSIIVGVLNNALEYLKNH